MMETLTHAAVRVGVTRITLWRAVRSGALGASPVRINGHWVLCVPDEAVDRWDAARCARRVCARLALAEARELIYQHCLTEELAKRGLRP